MKESKRILSVQEVLSYEVHSHRLASKIGFAWGQELISSYLVWKTRRKYKQYLYSMRDRNEYVTSKTNRNE